MEFTVFKDIIFDLINECKSFEIADIQSFDRENRYVVEMQDGQKYEIELSASTKKQT